MRNADFLDNPRPEDKLIGELQYDEDGSPYRIVDGKKIMQGSQETQRDRDLSLTINRVRASGLRPSEYLKSLYKQSKSKI